MDYSQTLKVNPVLQPRHLQFYFNTSKSTASRYMRLLRDDIGRKLITFLDFFKQYEAFPDPKFRPQWVDIPAPKKR